MPITFDHIGSCPNPPVFLIEGYTPKHGLAHGSLDVTVRACQGCFEGRRLQIEACGMTPYSFTGCPTHSEGAEGRLTALSCGDRTVFQENAFTAAHRSSH